MRLTLTVTDALAGRTVYKLMRNELSISNTLTRRLKRCDGIFLNGERAFTDRVTLPGDVLEIDVSAAEPESDLVPQDGAVNVLYENGGCLAADKPRGMLTHPSHAKYDGTLSNFVCGYLAAKGEAPVCHAVNRLDRDTAGIVLFAKNSYMKDLLTKSLAETGVKEYIALVCGRMPEREGVIDLPILRPDERDMLRTVSPDGVRAVTRYKVDREGTFEGHDVSLVRFVLETGRTHQIRVHTLAVGCPIIGDGLYRTGESETVSELLGISGQFLQAVKLTFFDPLEKNFVTVVSDIMSAELLEPVLWENL